jgi:hypothetical protein
MFIPEKGHELKESDLKAVIACMNGLDTTGKDRKPLKRLVVLCQEIDAIGKYAISSEIYNPMFSPPTPRGLQSPAQRHLSACHHFSK